VVGACSNVDGGVCLRPKVTGACIADSDCESTRCRSGQCVATCE
jgi:hypothetical protein